MCRRCPRAKAARESTQAIYDIEARSKSGAEEKANAQDYEGRDAWDTDVVAITGVQRRPWDP